MPRNVERDAEREQERRKKLIQAGFELFSENGIENVSLKEVADKANVGIATLYNYYQNKTRLVVAISADLWGKVWSDRYNSMDQEELISLNAYQRIENYIDIIINLYKTNPQVLRFSSDYKTYINRQKADRVDVGDHLDALSSYQNLFHQSYEKAKEDKSIRTDIPEKEMLTTVSLTMLGMAERYASGIVWTMHDGGDYINELYHTKSMILNWVKSEA